MGKEQVFKGPLVPFLLFLLVALIYWPTFYGEWTHDDFPVIVENTDIRSLKAFAENRYPGRPLRELSYLIDYKVFGLNPAGYAVQNILWHFAAGVLLWRLAIILGAAPWIGAGAAAFFLVHPLTVEVVANSSHRKDSLALVFGLLSLLTLARFFSGRSRYRMFWIIATLFCGVMAGLAKESAWLLPLLWFGFWRAYVAEPGHWICRCWGRLMLLGVVSGLGAVISSWLIWGERIYQKAAGLYASTGGYLAPDRLSDYFLPAVKGWAFMVLRILWPVNLGIEYSLAPPGHWLNPWVLGGALWLIVLVVLLALLPKRAPLSFFSVLMVLVFWLPVSNVWPLSYFAADRYYYAPMAGVSLLALSGVSAVSRRWQRPALGLLMLLVAVLAFLSHRQARVWESPRTLWAQSVRVSPDSGHALNNLGATYMEADRCGDAIPYFERAAGQFNAPMPFLNLARCQEKLGRRIEAEKNFRAFLSFNDPNYANLNFQVRWHLQQYYQQPREQKP